MQVTINKTTPSAEIVSKALAEVQINDANGRVITLQKPGVLAQFRIIEALGDSAKNQVYVSMVMPLIYVTAIDGAIVPPLEKKAHVEALILRLGEEGVVAVTESIMINFGVQTPEADKAALKN